MENHESGKSELEALRDDVIRLRERVATLEAELAHERFQRAKEHLLRELPSEEEWIKIIAEEPGVELEELIAEMRGQKP